MSKNFKPGCVAEQGRWGWTCKVCEHHNEGYDNRLRCERCDYESGDTIKRQFVLQKTTRNGTILHYSDYPFPHFTNGTVKPMTFIRHNSARAFARMKGLDYRKVKVVEWHE